MSVASAFAPGNISGLFKPIYGSDAGSTHSLGLGFTIREGVTARVAAAHEAAIRFNGERFRFRTVENVMERLVPGERLSVELESELPLSAGFGLSGASALATAYAIDHLLGLGLERREIAMAAHVAEVECLTGLGDVCGQFRGGCLAKLTPGDPLSAIGIELDVATLHFRCDGPLATDRVLSDASLKDAIGEAADVALGALEQGMMRGELTLARCLDISYQFSQQSGLLRLTEVDPAIRAIRERGGHASMIMLGNAIFSDVAFEGSTQTEVVERPAGVVS